MTNLINCLLIAHSKGYCVDAFGNVRSGRGNKLNPMTDNHGYLFFSVRPEPKSRKVTKVFVHRLQAFQKFGTAMFENGIEVRHLDGNQTNNSEANIDIGNHSQNQMDKPKATRIRVASMANKRYDHNEILHHYRSFGWKQTLEKFGISKGRLSDIINL